MARFYAEIEGQAKTTASRRGNVNSPCSGHIRGWGIGARVTMGVDPVDPDADVVTVELTRGSNSGATVKHLGTWRWDGEQLLNLSEKRMS